MSWISLLEEYFAKLIINISLIHQDWLNHTLQVTNRHPKVALKIDLRVQYFMLFLKINKNLIELMMIKDNYLLL